MIERHFLGWDAPIAAKVRDFLLPGAPSGTVDLSKDLIIVPTRHAARRLREVLALHTTAHGAALVPPHVDTPTSFFRPEGDPSNLNIATPIEVWALWADVLLKTDLSLHGGLFPTGVPTPDFHWAVRTGQMIQQVRDELADGGLSLGDVIGNFGEILEERDRWEDLAALERIYLDRVGAMGKEDPVVFMIRRARAPVLPAGIRRIILAAVPDPAPLAIRAIAVLAERVPVITLIHAPPSLSDAFDEWGRPIPERWQEIPIEIPDPRANILLAGSPASQSQKVLNLIAAESTRFGPADIAIGVPPDGSVTPFLIADLESHGLPPFDPAGKPFREHPLYRLLKAYQAFIGEGSYPTLSGLLRHPDVLHALGGVGVPAALLLAELDEFQNRFLPAAIEDFRVHLENAPAEDFPNLRQAIHWAQQVGESFQNEPLIPAVRSFLQDIYRGRTLQRGNPSDEAFISAAGVLDAILREAEAAMVALGFSKHEALDLLLERAGTQRHYMEHRGTRVDLEGWLELPWNDAPFLIVTGMNEGLVPHSRTGDPFLPDSLRTAIGLPGDRTRLAVDTFLMRGLIESRRADGRAVFIAGKTSAQGDPLKPSRLLFRCPENELADRARRLFGDPEEKRDNHAASISFRLKPVPPPDLPPAQLSPRRLSVTAFKDYLDCPFRFYLKHILGMEELADRKTELDAMEFGTLIHYALQRMAQTREIQSSHDEHRIARFLHAQAEAWVRERFGESVPLTVQVQIDAARSRLSAAARLQASLAAEGWQIVRSEMRIRGRLRGMDINGRIDRVDLHPPTGKVRLLDYKTTDRPTPPEDTHLRPGSSEAPLYARVHLNGKEKRWADLQLPLYRLLLPKETPFLSDVEIGYFNLPKAIGDTGVSIWEGFTQTLLDSARKCAEGVIEDIQNRRFWPPSADAPFDAFAPLFPADAMECIDGEAFLQSLERPPRSGPRDKGAPIS